MAKDRCTVVKKIIFSIFYLSLIITIFAGCGGVADIGAPTNATGSVSLAWDAPTQNLNGTPITNLSGFNVYYGTASRTYTHMINVRNVTSYTVNSLPSATYYFAITTYDSSGIESDYSDEISLTIP